MGPKRLPAGHAQRTRLPAGLAQGTLLAAGLAALGLPAPALSQVSYGGDALLVSRYEWRGITRGSGWAFQPAVFVRFDLRGPPETPSPREDAPGITAGAWTTLQFAPTRPGAFGLGRQAFGEVSPWVQVAGPAGPLEWAAGWTAYLFDGERGRAPGPGPHDTHELFARARLATDGPFMPAVAYYQDIDAVRGGYLEVALTWRVPLWPQAVLPLGSIYLGAGAGFSLGQEIGPDDPVGHFGERGLTHWDFSLALPVVPFIPLGPLELAPVYEMHLQLNRDPVGRLKGGAAEDGTTVWFRFLLSATGPRCRPQREICAR